MISAAGVVFFALAGAWLAVGEPCVEIRRCETATPLLSLATEPGTGFSLWFFHSYDRAFFEEHYRLERDGRIVLTHMTFKSSLNGQGFEMGVYRPLPDGSAELTDINKDVPEILFRLGSPDLANHTLFIGGRRLRLLDYAEAGDMICIRSGFRYRWQSAWDKVRVMWRQGKTEPPG
ncbi:MAG: DUF1850 domain-containing protein [Pseudomonadota bacterium]